jgi:predicted ABC-type exoprotein transport system permease subunit
LSGTRQLSCWLMTFILCVPCMKYIKCTHNRKSLCILTCVFHLWNHWAAFNEILFHWAIICSCVANLILILIFEIQPLVYVKLKCGNKWCNFLKKRIETNGTVTQDSLNDSCMFLAIMNYVVTYLGW